MGLRADREDVRRLTGWPTPDAQQFGESDSRWEERREEIKAKGINGNGFGLTLGMAVTLAADLSGWASQETMDRNARPLNEQAVMLAGWTTPQASEPETADRPSRAATGRTTEYLGRQVAGMTSASSPAATASAAGAVLNPAMSRWLMGFPASGATLDWDRCSPHWSAWATVQTLLAGLSVRPGETGSED